VPKYKSLLISFHSYFSNYLVTCLVNCIIVVIMSASMDCEGPEKTTRGGE
jgi:hypothetical protein